MLLLPADHDPLSEEQKREFCLMLSMGCDRQTACNYLGKTAEALRHQLRVDAAFRKQLLQAEATPEFNHMRNLYNAAKDEKNWRVSVWWLERNAPDRYAHRSPETLTSSQLRSFIERLSEALAAEISDPKDRQQLLARLSNITNLLDKDSLKRASTAEQLDLHDELLESTSASDSEGQS